MFPDKAGSILYRKMVLGTRIRTCFRGMVSKKTYREKTKLNRNIECKGAYSVADLFLWKELDGGVSIMKKDYKIAIAGTGYVGLSIATLLSQHHQVTAVDIIPEKVDMINNRKSPIQDEYIEKYLTEKDLDLTATLDAKAAYSDADFVVIAALTNVYSTNRIDVASSKRTCFAH